MALIVTRDLEFRYPNAKEIVAFPDFTIESGQGYWISGKSGVGKTTLLHLILGTLNHYDGSLKVLGKEWKQCSQKQQTYLRGKHIGFASQQPMFQKNLTILENIQFVSLAAVARNTEIDLYVLAEELGVGECLNKFSDALSMGQQQRCQVLKLLCYDYDILLLDEPTANLDVSNQKLVLDKIWDYSKGNRSVMLVSHDDKLQMLESNIISL